eukprot:c4799_g1_i1.p1 GENE.c4799_g1_i1~~c4799_g1_i1.p1  ORF type:complete len:407 (+),score=59.95 c4799_g1_i1:117-1337(+)
MFRLSLDTNLIGKRFQLRRVLGCIGWAIGSIGLVFYNEWLFVGEGNFKFPLTVTLIHCICTGIVGTISSMLYPIEHEHGPFCGGPSRCNLGRDAVAPPPAPDVHANFYEWALAQMGWSRYTFAVYLKYHVPIAMFYWANVSCNNLAFSKLEVNFLTMLKATGPAWVLLFTVIIGSQRATPTLVTIISIICGGTLISSIGEVHFSYVGFLFAISATILSALRTSFIERAYIFAPLSGRQFFPSTTPIPTVILFFWWASIEAKRFVEFASAAADGNDAKVHNSSGRVALLIFISISLASIGNYGRYLWIASSSSIIYEVAAVVKDMLIIIFSFVLLGDKMTVVKMIGFSFTFVGVVWFMCLEHKSVHEMEAHKAGDLEADAGLLDSVHKDEHDNVSALSSQSMELLDL